MTDYKESRWAKSIISLQHEDGSWGFFHSLCVPTKSDPITTEQALKRLEILGFTIDDEPIQKAVSYIHSCLAGENQIPDRREKLHDWGIFNSMMFSAWIRRFTKEDKLADQTARLWAEIIRNSFAGGTYEHDRYVEEDSSTSSSFMWFHCFPIILRKRWKKPCSIISLATIPVFITFMRNAC